MIRYLAVVLLSAPVVLAAATPQIPILAYHEVVAGRPAAWAVNVDDFTDQMELLAAVGYTVVPIADVWDYLSNKRDSLPPNPIVITVDDGWGDAYTHIRPILQRFRYPWSLYVYPNIIGRGAKYLTWQQIIELSRAGVDIQSHTMRHSHLMRRSHAAKSDSAYADWLKVELADSKSIIEQKTGKPVRFLAYPFGEYDAGVQKAATTYGYAIGLTSQTAYLPDRDGFGLNNRKTNPLALLRFTVASDTTISKFLEGALLALPLQLEKITPAPGAVANSGSVSAVIGNPSKLVRSSIRVVLLGEKATGTFDARTGRVTVRTEKLTRQRQQVVVWGKRRTDGRLVASSWTFYTTADAKARTETTQQQDGRAAAAATPKIQ